MTKPTQQEIEQMAEYYRLQQAGMSTPAIAERFNKTRDYISSKIYRYKLHYLKKPTEFQTVTLGTPLELRGDFVVVGDVHVPTTDYDFAMLAGAVAKKHLPEGNRRLIIGGDFFCMDAFSNYAATVRAPSWKEERDAGRVLLKAWLEVFDEIYIIMGNHDRRLQKWAAGQLDETDIFGMVLQTPKITVSNWGWLTVQTDKGPWRITHGSNYSVNAGTVGSELANKFQCNVISHHQHHAAKTLDKYKRFAVIDNGTLADFSQFAYVALDDNKMPNMTNAFTLLKGGVGHLLWKHPALTDWSLWL